MAELQKPRALEFEKYVNGQFSERIFIGKLSASFGYTDRPAAPSDAQLATAQRDLNSGQFAGYQAWTEVPNTAPVTPGEQSAETDSTYYTSNQ